MNDFIHQCLCVLVTVLVVALLCAFVAGIMIVGVGKLGFGSSPLQRGSVHSRSYNLNVSGKRGLERSTLLETSDEEF